MSVTTIRWRVLAVNQAENCIIVRYWSVKMDEVALAQCEPDGSIACDPNGKPLRCRTDYNIMLPHPLPSDEAIDEIITNAAPVEWLRTIELIRGKHIDKRLLSLVGRANERWIVDERSS